MKNTRLAAIIALLLALVMSFTSCAVIDNAQGLIDGSVTLDEILSGDPSDGATPEEPDEPSNPDNPSNPDTPAEPDPDTPAEPDPDTPAEPDPDTPAEPDPDTPAEPDPDTPAEPEIPEDTTDYPADGKSDPAIDSYRPLASIPEYNGENYTVINGNYPYFLREDLGYVAYTYYSQFDSLGRAGLAVGCLGPETLPTTDRKDPSYDPTGWVQASYSGDLVTGGKIWNRSHLIAWSLGSDSGKYNLVTGTPYFNQRGMVMFEDMVRDYIKETGNHVLYRVVPVFVGDELVCRGVTIEAFSIEDNGGKNTPEESDGICFNVFVHNVNPGIDIDYATGNSSITPGYEPEEPDTTDYIYVLNTSSKKIHLPDCPSVTTMSEKNKGYSNEDIETLKGKGYTCCGSCHPENHQP